MATMREHEGYRLVRELHALHLLPIPQLKRRG